MNVRFLVAYDSAALKFSRIFTFYIFLHLICLILKLTMLLIGHAKLSGHIFMVKAMSNVFILISFLFRHTYPHTNK